jgi:hypothetical protein
MVVRLTTQGLPDAFAADVAELWSNVAAGSLAVVTSTVRQLTGDNRRTFDEFLAITAVPR